MNFIKKMILDRKQAKQLEEEIKLKSSCSRYMMRVEDHIDLLKMELAYLKSHRKKVNPITIRSFISMINLVKTYYTLFLDDLKDSEYLYNNTHYKNVKTDLKPQIEYMHKKKKEYRIEFENIYCNFKCISKGVEFPNRNEILGLMRDAFDFDGSKYHQEVSSKAMLWHTI